MEYYHKICMFGFLIIHVCLPWLFHVLFQGTRILLKAETKQKNTNPQWDHSQLTVLLAAVKSSQQLG